METSLRYSKDFKSLRIHAKQKLPIYTDTFLQVHGELDTRFGSPSYFCAMLRRFYTSPQLDSSLGIGMGYDKHEKLKYTVRGKMAFPVTSGDDDSNSICFNVKGRCDVDKDISRRKFKGAAEFTWTVLNFQKEQDVRFKVGYDVTDKVPYFQFRENNWTVNADAKGRWDVRYDL